MVGLVFVVDALALAIALIAMGPAVFGAPASAPPDLASPVSTSPATSEPRASEFVPPSQAPTILPTQTPTVTESPTQQPSPSAVARGPGLPDPSLTPGALSADVTQASIQKTICVVAYTTQIRPASSFVAKLKVQQIAQYGYEDAAPAHYDEDHLIPLELGGAPKDPANLWPEPLHVPVGNSTDLGSQTKDRFENYLHRLVCATRVTLASAQEQMRDDWVLAWQAAGSP